MKRSIILSAIFTLFIFGCGGSFNPLIWKTQIDRFTSPNQLIQPDKVALFYEEMREEIKEDPEDIFWYIKFKVKYSNDLVNHGAFNHLATAEEVLQSGRDDCDGQAVLLCSVLRYAGYEAYTLIGASHSWVEVQEEEILPIDYKGGDWFVRFNESSTEWNINLYFFMAVQEFLLFLVFFSVVLYCWEKGAFVYLGDSIGYMKYVVVLFLVGAGLIVIFARFWTFGLIVTSVSALVAMEIVSRLRGYLRNRPQKRKE
jgi:hypothetical protein